MTADVRELLAREPHLVRWAARRAVRSAPGLDVDDAASAVALRALQKAHQFDPRRGAFSTWLARISRTVARSHRSYLGRMPRTSAELARHPAAVEDLDEQHDLVVLKARLLLAIARLPRRERAVIVRRFGLDGKGCRLLFEIDPRVSRERNRQRVVKALERLRRIMRAAA